MKPIIEEDEPLASDKIDSIKDWINDIYMDNKSEKLSYFDLLDIDEVYDIIKLAY